MLIIKDEKGNELEVLVEKDRVTNEKLYPLQINNRGLIIVNKEDLKRLFIDKDIVTDSFEAFKGIEVKIISFLKNNILTINMDDGFLMNFSSSIELKEKDIEKILSIVEE